MCVARHRLQQISARLAAHEGRNLHGAMARLSARAARSCARAPSGENACDTIHGAAWPVGTCACFRLLQSWTGCAIKCGRDHDAAPSRTMTDAARSAACTPWSPQGHDTIDAAWLLGTSARFAQNRAPLAAGVSTYSHLTMTTLEALATCCRTCTPGCPLTDFAVTGTLDFATHTLLHE